MLPLICFTLLPMELDKPEHAQFIHTAAYFNAGVLALQTYALWRLKKNNQLFGIHPTGRRFDIMSPAITQDILSFSVIFPAVTGASEIVCNQNAYYFAKAVAIPILLLGITHATNMAYMDCLSDIQSSLPSRKIELTSKIPIPVKLISEQTCPICLDTPRNDAINPCSKNEHIYCRPCLNTWLSQSNKENPVLQCLLCYEKITPESSKVTISSKNINVKKTPSKKALCYRMIGVEGFCVMLMLYHLYNTLACTL